MTQPVEKFEDEQPISHHYVFVLIVEVVTLTALWLFSRAYS